MEGKRNDRKKKFSKQQVISMSSRLSVTFDNVSVFFQ
jgi:hypothetical protein